MEGDKVKEIIFAMGKSSRILVRSDLQGRHNTGNGKRKISIINTAAPTKEISLKKIKSKSNQEKVVLSHLPKAAFLCEEKMRFDAQTINTEIDTALSLTKNSTIPERTAICNDILKKNLITLLDLNNLSAEQYNDLQYLKKFGITVYYSGWLGLSSEKSFEKIRDIHTAIKKQKKLLDGYQNTEKDEYSFAEIIKKCNGILYEWKHCNIHKKLIFKQQLIATISTLEHCHNEFNLDIKNQLAAALSSPNKTKKTDFGLSATGTAKNFITLLLIVKEFNSTQTFIALRRELLIYLLLWQKTIMAEAIKSIKRNNALKTYTILGKIIFSPYWEQAEQAKFWIENHQAKKKCGHPLLAKKCLDIANKILQDNIESAN
jgi:hypothetical protein